VNEVKSARLLAGDGTPLKVQQSYDPMLKHHSLSIDLPADAPDENVSVLVLEIDDEPEVEPLILQQPDGHITLEAFLGELEPGAAGSMAIGRGGAVEGWTDASGRVLWEFKALEAGPYEVELLTLSGWHGAWRGGQDVQVTVDRTRLDVTVEEHERRPDRGSLHYWENVVTRCGRVEIPYAGTFTAGVRLVRLPGADGPELRLRALRLVPAAAT
jgi:hypothetical protein